METSGPEFNSTINVWELYNCLISGAATPEQIEACIQTVKDQLATPFGLGPPGSPG
jgi:hypothetical protein